MQQNLNIFLILKFTSYILLATWAVTSYILLSGFTHTEGSNFIGKLLSVTFPCQGYASPMVSWALGLKETYLSMLNC